MITVLEPGLLTTVQDVVGRQAWRHLGVPSGGAADPDAARLANRLVGNPDGAPLLEATLQGPHLRFERACTVAVAGGDLDAVLAGSPLSPGRARVARPGTVLRFGGARRGTRAYIALGGGLHVPRVLGSAATDLRSRFGGFHGRALRAGDRLTLEHANGPGPLFETTAHEPDAGPIRILAGPHLERLAEGALDALCAAPWSVAHDSDRAGIRLERGRHGGGTELSGAEVASTGLPLGAIQLPPDGRPIVMLADRPVTGGYAVLACVARADIGRMAQSGTGELISFERIETDAAVAALHERERRLAALRPIGPDAADGAGWAGWPG